MLRYSFVLLVLLCVLQSGVAQHNHGHPHKNWWEDSKVVELTSDNWDKYVGTDKNILVEFYAQWCGWCRRMAPEYELVWEYFMGDHTKRHDVVVARVDGHIYQEISALFNVHGFPSILFFKKNSPLPSSKFEDQRDAVHMITFVEDIVGPAPEEASQEAPSPAPEEAHTESAPSAPASLDSEALERLLMPLKERNAELTEELDMLKVRVSQLEAQIHRGASSGPSTHTVMWMGVLLVVFLAVVFVARALTRGKGRHLPMHTS
eukprot:GILI01040472.1.p1 GENE.GILI01040472.1~~GILI01040472.1.p1  ORF type:complete len:262 (+),score=53.38 GILI01040472.1:135-920(+)